MTRGTYAPRDYQQRSIDQVRAACAQGLRTILVLPTGGGKTKTAVYGIVQRAVSANASVLWLAHRSELISQADGDLLEAGVRTGIIQGSVKPDPAAPCQVASIQTLARRLDTLPDARIVIVDEAHHVRSATYMSVIQHYQQAGAYIVGLTATPMRLDGKGLGLVFDSIVEEITARELMDRGFLAEYDYFAPSVPDMAAVKTSAGDYNRGDAAEVMNKSAITGCLVTHYRKHMDGKRALAFATGVAHSESIVAAFVAEGIPAAHLDGTTPKKVRSATLAQFERGEVLVVSNVDLFDEGFDVPSCQGVMIARPTQSFVKHRQMIGRCLRVKADGSRAVVLDHAGNFSRHGMPDDITEWSLADTPKEKNPAPAHRQCPECFAVAEVGAKVCSCCGHEFKTTPRAGPSFEDGELKRVKARVWTPSDKAELYRTLMAKARTMGYKPGWAKRQYRAKVKTWPKGFVTEVDAESFRLCKHVKTEGLFGDRCKHCGDVEQAARIPGSDAGEH